jgi:hypothetical protein
MRKFLLITLLCALVVFACKDEPPADDPKTQTTIITTSFGDITVTGFFTNAEWEGVPDKIKTAFNYCFSRQPEIVQNTVSAKSVTVIVEKNPTYTNYSTTRNGNTIRINFAIVNDTETLINAIAPSCLVLAGATEIPEQG